MNFSLPTLPTGSRERDEFDTDSAEMVTVSTNDRLRERLGEPSAQEAEEVYYEALPEEQDYQYDDFSYEDSSSSWNEQDQRDSVDLEDPSSLNSGNFNRMQSIKEATEVKPELPPIPAFEEPAPEEERHSVARVDEVSFTKPKGKKRKLTVKPTYVGKDVEAKAPAPTKRKAKSKKTSKKAKKKLTKIDYMTRGGWAFCGLLFLRLLFSGGGILDYYSKQSYLDDKYFELNLISEENKGLVREIEKIKKDRAYQKKLVRDNLGFIAKDEYLVLFAKSRQAKTN